MGFLDSKERILDVVLTDKGRSELSKNNLNFAYYSFSDEGVDYSGSLDLSRQSGTLDERIYRTPLFEADMQKSDKRFSQNSDLSTFLFTIPSYFQVIPDVVTSFDNREDISLARRFYIDQLVLSTRKINRIRKPKAIVVRVAAIAGSLEARINSYVNRQKITATLQKKSEGKNILGDVVAPDYIAIRGDKALNTKTGHVIPLDSALEIAAQEGNTEDVVNIKKEVEVVTGVGFAKIDLQLKTGDESVFVKDGFLIEVFESGSDGRLTKVVKENVNNPLNDDEIEKGFEDFLILEVDI